MRQSAAAIATAHIRFNCSTDWWPQLFGTLLGGMSFPSENARALMKRGRFRAPAFSTHIKASQKESMSSFWLAFLVDWLLVLDSSTLRCDWWTK